MRSSSRKSPPSSAKQGGLEVQQQRYYTRPDVEAVRARAAGNWLAIMASVAPSLEDAIAHLGAHVRCPHHGRRDGFRLDRDAAVTGIGYCNELGSLDGFGVLMMATGKDFPTVLQEVADWLGMNDLKVDLPLPNRGRPRARKLERDPRRAAALNQMWMDCVDWDDPLAKPAISYLASRGLAGVPLDPKALLFHPRLKYVPEDGGPVRYLPGIVARIVNVDGVGTGLHRTFLTPDGEKVGRKKMRAIYDGATRGGAVRLFPATERLMVGEGLETCLAAWLQMRGEWPVWSAVDAGGLAALQLPSDVREVIILADNDPSHKGQDAAAVLAARLRLEGRKVSIALPLTEGQDWADVLMATMGQEVSNG